MGCGPLPSLPGFLPQPTQVTRPPPRLGQAYLVYLALLRGLSTDLSLQPWALCTVLSMWELK